MKKKKLSLNQLKINSFITSLNSQNSNTIKSGNLTISQDLNVCDDGNTNECESNACDDPRTRQNDVYCGSGIGPGPCTNTAKATAGNISGRPGCPGSPFQ